MAKRVIYSIQNDSLDAICYRYYGESVVEEVMAANPQLARADVILPIGTAVILPNIIQTTANKQTIQLWD